MSAEENKKQKAKKKVSATLQRVKFTIFVCDIFNPFILEISEVNLLTVCHVILMMIAQRIW